MSEIGEQMMHLMKEEGQTERVLYRPSLPSPANRSTINAVGAGYAAAGKTITKIGAFAGYTFVDGDQVHIAGGTNVTPGLYAASSRMSNDTIVLSGTPTGALGGESDWTIDYIQHTATEITVMVKRPGPIEAMSGLAMNILVTALNHPTKGIPSDPSLSDPGSDRIDVAERLHGPRTTRGLGKIVEQDEEFVTVEVL